jgi:hypothetical protein
MTSNLPKADQGTQTYMPFPVLNSVLCLYGSVCWRESMVHVEQDDDFYELQPADYYKLFSNRMAGNLCDLNIVWEHSYSSF